MSMPAEIRKSTGGARFRKGQSGNPAGRPKGTPNKVTRDIRAFCQALLARPAYLVKFLRAWDRRELAPRLEEMIWAYAHGKPTQSIEADVTLDALADAMRRTIERHPSGGLGLRPVHLQRGDLTHGTSGSER